MSDVKYLAIRELQRSKDVHEKGFVDDHHGYAIVLEELQETAEELETICNLHTLLWEEIRNDDAHDETINHMESACDRLVTEAVQLYAMVLKFKELVNNEQSNI